MNKTEQALKPCPFCTSENLHIETNSIQPEGFHDAYVVCSDCEAQGRHAMTLEGWLSSKEEAKAEAIAAWNNRHTSQSEAPAEQSEEAFDRNALAMGFDLARASGELGRYQMYESLATETFAKGRACAKRDALTQAPQGFDAEFLSKRLARVAKLVGYPMPDMTHEQIAEVAGTILGAIAGKMESEQAPQERAVPAGWKLVPVDPTKEMWDAVNKLDDEMAAGAYDGKGCSIEQAWECLLAAAPDSTPTDSAEKTEGGAA